jgi:acyl carrier protein
MNEDDIRRRVTEVFREIAPEYKVRSLRPEVSFRDQAEIDSVDFLNFMLRLEKALGIRIPEEDYPKLSSPNGCVEYLKSRVTEKGASPGE